MKKLILIGMLFCFFVSAAQVESTEIKNTQKRLLEINVHFQLDKHHLDSTYMGNKESLECFAHKIDSIGLEHIDSVLIISQSSPEGSYHHNIWLTEQRAITMRKYMISLHPELKDKFFVHTEGESWSQLKNLIQQDTLLKTEEIKEALLIIDADINIDIKKKRMQQLSFYNYLLDTYYPHIRNSMLCIMYFAEKTKLPTLRNANSTIPVKPIESFRPSLDLSISAQSLQKKTIFALKSNLLYDAVTALNFEVEVPIGDRWSIMVEDVFPWWNNGNKWAFQILEIGAEGRYWFKRTPVRDVLSGYFGGLYVMSGKYDLQWKRDLNYQGEYWSTGITAGYSFPIGKFFNLELSASIGYLSSGYRHYQPSQNYEELIRDPKKQGRIGYFGPTKLKVSLVLPITITTRKGVRHE